MIDFYLPADILEDRSMTAEDSSLHTVDIGNTAEGVPVFVYRCLSEQTVAPAKIGDTFTDKAGQRWLATPTGWRPAASDSPPLST
jgi:hypothetical protein